MLKLEAKMENDITGSALNVDRIIKGKIKQLSGNTFFIGYCTACVYAFSVSLKLKV